MLIMFWLVRRFLFRVFLPCMLLTVTLAVSYGEIIPANRRITWQAGVPGGVPSRTNIFADVTQSPYNADKTGAADASGAIQNAINACTVGKVVYIPAGTYRLNSQLTINKGIVVRGAGPD